MDRFGTRAPNLFPWAKPEIRAPEFLVRSASARSKFVLMPARWARKRRRKAAAAAAAARTEPVPRKPREVSAAISTGALALAIVGIGLAIDSGADASFDAPKRLIVPRPHRRRGRSPLLHVSAGLAPGAETIGRPGSSCSLVRRSFSQLPCSRRSFLPAAPLPTSAWRVLFLYGLLLVLGASPAFAKGRKILLGAFLADLGGQRGRLPPPGWPPVSALRAAGSGRPGFDAAPSSGTSDISR